MTLAVDVRQRLGAFTLQAAFESAGRLTAFFGPSGSGKTSLVNLVAGLGRPEAGRIAVDGRVLVDSEAGVFVPAHRRRIGYVFQEARLFPHLTVRQNLAFARQPFARRWLNPPRQVHDEAVQRWLSSFGLDGVADLYPQQISGGQRQRTALARALVNDPAALLLDEPFAALDADLRRRLRDELCELQARLRIPLLLITHDDEDVAALADEVVHLQAGRVVAGAQACAAAE
jgi:molybdate transport system ATP-binding protein